MSQVGLEESYNRNLVLRGYDPSSGKFVVLKRVHVNCWGESGFHHFWRVWNPGIGHFLFKLCLILGGNRRLALASMIVLAVCGLFHDVLVMLIFRQPFFAFSPAFLSFDVLALTNRLLEPVSYRDRWPSLVNALINAACMRGSVHAAVQMQRTVHA